MAETGAARRLDGLPARLAALLIALALVAVMVWIGRIGFAGVPLTPFENLRSASASSASATPALAECLELRVGAVDEMRKDGIVSPAQYETFRERAVSYCEAQFPPER